MSNLKDRAEDIMEQKYRKLNTNENEMKANKLSPVTVVAFLLLSITTNVMAQTQFEGALRGVSITDSAGTNSPPTASFQYTKDGATFSFNAQESFDSDGKIVKYNWDFGNGNISSGSTATYQNMSTEDFQATLTVIDDKGAVSLYQKKISIASSDLGDTTAYADGKISINIDRRYGFKLIGTPKTNGTLKSISALVINDSGTQAKRLKFSLYTHDSINNMPDTLVGTTIELLSSSVIGNPSWLTGQVTGTLQVITGNQYWVVIEALDKYLSVAKGQYGSTSKTRCSEQYNITPYDWSNWSGTNNAVNTNYPYSVYITYY